MGTFTYETPIGALDIHAHGNKNVIEYVAGGFISATGEESSVLTFLANLDEVQFVNLLACNSASLAGDLAKGSGKYVGGMTKKFVVGDGGGLFYPEGQTMWQIFNSDGIKIAELIDPAYLQEIADETARILNQ